MTEKYITLETGIDYGIRDTSNGKLLFEQDITDLLNEQHETIQHLNKVIERTEYSNNLKDKHMHKAQMNELQYKQKVKSILQQNYNLHKNNFDSYGAIAIQNVAKELGVELE